MPPKTAPSERYYTIVDAALMSGPGAVDLIPENTEMGRYAARSPYQAARKAASKLYCRYTKLGWDADEFCFGLREQTRNAPRMIRLYVARRVKLAKPVSWPVTTKNEGCKAAVKNTETHVRAVWESDEVASVLALLSSKKNLTEEYPKPFVAAAGAAADDSFPAAPARPDLFTDTAATSAPTSVMHE